MANRMYCWSVTLEGLRKERTGVDELQSLQYLVSQCDLPQFEDNLLKLKRPLIVENPRVHPRLQHSYDSFQANLTTE